MGESYRSDGEYGNIMLSYQYLIEKLRINRVSIGEVKILDIGTNKGSLPYLLYKNHDAYVCGVDVDESQIAKGKVLYPDISERLDAVDNSLRKLEDASFDIVTMFDVIEHIPDVSSYLKNEVMRVLKPGGLFVFQTPNARINPIYEIIQSKSFTRWKEYHCSLQTPKSLSNILKNTGFTEIVIEKYRIDSQHNREKINRYFGPLSGFVICVFQHMPLALYPNIWGVCKKTV